MPRRTCCHENKFTWKLSLLCHAAVQKPTQPSGAPTCVMFLLLPSSWLGGVTAPLCSWWKLWVFIYIWNANPADCGSVHFFFSAAAAESMTPPSALQRRAGLRLVLRLGSGLHLKLSFPDCFSCYEHLPCQSPLRWLTGSLLLRENLSRFISP